MRSFHPIATLPLFLGIAFVVSQTLAADFTGRVVGVSDGDTITVLSKGKPVRIRLHGIDSLGNVMRDGPDKRSIHSHVGDAMGHGLARIFVPRPQYYPRVDRQKGMKRATSYSVP